jgi:hypothetical protein
VPIQPHVVSQQALAYARLIGRPHAGRGRIARHLAHRDPVPSALLEPKSGTALKRLRLTESI